jgi:hypothetical protein
MITISSSGSFANTERFLTRMSHGSIMRTLESYGQQGVDALSSATPIRTGLAASSWYYLVENNRSWYSITWCNNDTENGGAPVVVLIQYGHSTRNGGYVAGYDFINPAIRPVFDQIASEVWREVTNS